MFEESFRHLGKDVVGLCGSDEACLDTSEVMDLR
jgi:hypothetical protein